MKKILFVLLALISGISFFSCDQEELHTERYYLEVKDATINAPEYNKWHYFSFTTGTEVGVGNANLTSDAEWAKRTDWDIAFTTLYVRLNCGKSGAGLAGSLEISPAVGTDKELAFNSIVNAVINPAKVYTTDMLATSKAPLVIGINPQVTYLGSYNDVASKWIELNKNVVPSGDYLSSRKTFIFKTVDGKYAKVLLKSFLEGKNGSDPIDYVKDPVTGENTTQIQPSAARKGIITFSYAYQPDGSTTLMTKTQE